MTRTFFRIVKSNPPTESDFTSNFARGRRLPKQMPVPLQELWTGLSVYDRLGLARRKGELSPMLGSYIVELRIPEGSSIRVQRTTADPGHFTIWGEPSEVTKCITNIHPILRRVKSDPTA